MYILEEKIWTVAANVIKIWVGLKNPVITPFSLELCATALDNYYICEIEYIVLYFIVYIVSMSWRT